MGTQKMKSRKSLDSALADIAFTEEARGEEQPVAKKNSLPKLKLDDNGPHPEDTFTAAAEVIATPRAGEGAAPDVEQPSIIPALLLPASMNLSTSVSKRGLYFPLHSFSSTGNDCYDAFDRQ